MALNPAPEAPGFTVRPYQTGDEPGLLHLFERTYREPVTAEHWRWKFMTLPAPTPTVWLAAHEGAPVFHYGGVATRFSLSQVPATVMVTADAVTAPEFRRRGLLTRTLTQAHACWQEAGVPFVFGLPNNQWGSRTQALGWRKLFPLQWLILPLHVETYLARRTGTPLLAKARIAGALCDLRSRLLTRGDPQVVTRPVSQGDTAFGDLWDRLKGHWQFSTIRDAQWVNWRFMSCPSRRYVLALAARDGKDRGYSAYRMVQSPGAARVYLADLFAAPDDDATRRTLLRSVLDEVRAARPECVFALAVPGTPLFRFLRGAGFLPRWTFDVELVPLSRTLPWDRMLDPALWNLSGADFDVI